MELMGKAMAHDAPETPRVIVERMKLTGKGKGVAYDWRREPPGEPAEREKKSPGAGGAEGNNEGENQYAPIVAQSAENVKPRTRREIILSALNAMGELIEDDRIVFFDLFRDRLTVHAPDTFDAIAARNGAEIVVAPRNDEMFPFERSAVIGGVKFYRIETAEEAARYVQS